MTSQILLLFGGLVILVAGAETLVRAASDLARAAGIKPLVVGLTVVALGTSTPELAVSVQAALAGQGDVALGNVVGSNVINVLVILGLSAIITPLVVSKQLVRRDVPFLIGVSALVLLLALDHRIGTLEGLGLLALGVGYTAYLGRMGVRKSLKKAAKKNRELPGWKVWVMGGLQTLVGLAALVIGADLFLDAAVSVARTVGVGELVIGITLVSVGTSLPELATSIIAALRGERDIAVGNIVGSNIFNILIVLGTASVISPNGLAVPPGALTFDLPVILLVSVACFPIFFTGWVISRREGILFLSYYVAYTAYLFFDGAGHAANSVAVAGLIFVALPLTALLAFGIRLRRRGTESSAS